MNPQYEGFRERVQKINVKDTPPQKLLNGVNHDYNKAWKKERRISTEL